MRLKQWLIAIWLIFPGLTLGFDAFVVEDIRIDGLELRNPHTCCPQKRNGNGPLRILVNLIFRKPAAGNGQTVHL